MSTDVKNGIKLACAGHNVRQAEGVLPQRLLRVQEVDGDVVVLELLDRARVEGRLAALGRGDGQVDLGVENMPGVGEFGLSRQQRCHKKK